jgi:hypothetical protein
MNPRIRLEQQGALVFSKRIIFLDNDGFGKSCPPDAHHIIS